MIKKADLYKMIKEIKELLDKEGLIEHQESGDVPMGLCDIHKIRFAYIRYLQDQVNKITEGLE